MLDDPRQRPSPIPWPPLLLVGAVAGGYLLDRLYPVGLGNFALGRGAGAVLIASALMLELWCAWTLHRHATTVMPHKASSALVTEGPYAVSRNPIYIGHTTLVLGIGLFLNNAWIGALALPFAFALDRLAARREEAHLAASFGAAWLDYAKRVPRWL